MTTTQRLASALTGGALAGAGVQYLGGASPWAAAGGALALFFVLFSKLKRVEN